MSTRTLGLVAMVMALAGCSNGGSGGSSGVQASPGGSAEVEGVWVDLSPLPLKIKASSPKAHVEKESSGGDGVVVDVDDTSTLNIHEATRDLAEQKKSYEATADSGYQAFKRWAKETPDMAVEEFEQDGKPGFMAFTVKTIGGKKYLCRTMGSAGAPSVELAERRFRSCTTLSAK